MVLPDDRRWRTDRNTQYSDPLMLEAAAVVATTNDRIFAWRDSVPRRHGS